ncbi:hypothetical protein [Microbulbifer variabilis]|uniref:hypothetical protein n=1 Tax=Microbulbifer variabilis TaxID=266805 RepID=UPI001CFF1E57|nr:hypothetical protein [Microbulbifer variabilis]
MHKSQLYFGALVGLLVMTTGWVLALAGINAAALMAVGLAVLLANIGYGVMRQVPEKIRQPLSERHGHTQRRKH